MPVPLHIAMVSPTGGADLGLSPRGNVTTSVAVGGGSGPMSYVRTRTTAESCAPASTTGRYEYWHPASASSETEEKTSAGFRIVTSCSRDSANRIF